jgi:hypothetical protein
MILAAPAKLPGDWVSGKPPEWYTPLSIRGDQPMHPGETIADLRLEIPNWIRVDTLILFVTEIIRRRDPV